MGRARAQTKGQILISNLHHYITSGQSVIPPKNLFLSGHFDFINGEVVPTQKATKALLKDKRKTPRFIIEGVKLDPNAGTESCLQVTVKYNGEQCILTFGGDHGYSYYSDTNTSKELSLLLNTENKVP
jgi:hypothetical protein